jgi:hypothetical protein
MNDDFLARGLATLAEDMPTPDVGDIVGIARARKRRRRAVGTTVLGTLAAVGVLTSAVLANHERPVEPPAHQQHQSSTVDARAQSLDQQWTQAENQLLPPELAAALDPQSLGFTVVDSDYAPGTLADNRTGTPTPFTRTPFAGRAYRLTAQLSTGGNFSTLTITILHSTYPAPDALPVAPVINAAPSELTDGTRAVVSPTGSGTGVQMQALRTDGTFIDVRYTGPPAPASAGGISLPPGMTSASGMVQFALAFTY